MQPDRQRLGGRVLLQYAQGIAPANTFLASVGANHDLELLVYRKVSFAGRHFYRHMGTENKIKIIHIVARRYFLLEAHT